ncbi:TraR/DksA C4-type zinc finger protein [Pseudomonas sp. MSSRFD41]|uniref:TraR/DksA C4-type zinc finger protein n=1 Tax=Pseudomonas sp. MSSRFD41 TaxID=1310370 RepID=UPI00163A9C18|nr:TraR/DksA C4-type zinc finger protein [Pseudomonas sp. MSSRFD41]MBC2658306.1 TraR/DksA C4-type zinc finger protein [Pseudomonas sp. MSSRFD41]
MDVADLAQDNDFTEAALQFHHRGVQRRSGPSAYRCSECGDAIPQARREAEPGTEHCVDCKRALEHLTQRGPR